MKNIKFIASIILAAIVSLSCEAASKIRLIYGKDWSEGSRRVKAKLENLEKGEARGKYQFEYIDEESTKAEQNPGTLKIPAIFVISEEGNCFLVLENKVGAKALSAMSEKEIFEKILEAENAREAAKKSELKSADDCGRFLEKMEPFVGGLKRVAAKGFHEDVFAALKRYDPKDELGWQRRFTMGDGLDIVTKATAFKNQKDFAGGEAYIAEEFAKPTKHLSTEQVQSLYMAKFALYREEKSKREEMKKLLKDVLKLGEETLWGTSAIGWLNILGEPPLSVYWGWHKGDFKGNEFSAIIQYGVDCSFKEPGDYTIKFAKKSGAGKLEFDEVALWANKGEEQKIFKAAKHEESQGTAVFGFKVEEDVAGFIKMLEVKGKADQEGLTEGSIEIKKNILRARGKAQ